MNMHRWIYAVFGCVLLFVFILCGAGVVSEELKIAKGNAIIDGVEQFRSKHGRLPKNLREMNLPDSESGPLYYDKVDNGKDFIVWYGTTLGESVTYSSETGRWDR